MIRNAADSVRVASAGDAFVEVDRSVERWTIGNDAIRCSLRVARAGTLALDGFFIGGSDDPIGNGDGIGALVNVAGTAHHLGATGSAFTVAGIDSSSGADFVALEIRFVARESPLRPIRRFLVRPDAAVVEMWTEFNAVDEDGVSITDLNTLTLMVPTGTIEWVAGLEPSGNVPSFTKQNRSVGDGETFTLSSPLLSSLGTLPYFSIGNGHRRFFAGLGWSGGWSASFARHGEVFELSIGLPDMSATVRPEAKVETAHAIVGVVPDQPGADGAALSAFVYASRGGRDFPAWTTFNTWFLHGTHIDERIIRADMDAAAAIGIELFQIDAGWYASGRQDAAFDFIPGLGSWTLDLERFPSGFAALREYADRRGIRLGIWFEPERAALDQVGQRGLLERFLAQQDGRYDPSLPNEEARDAQICLADPAARAWVLERLSEVIDASAVDNLKWDLNRWVACTRAGHGHPANGGNYAHTRGLYEVIDTLRSRYPSLAIENCAGGARRADFAMAQRTDAAWMDDRTAPSVHVRYNLDGLLSVFPAPYLFSYVMAHPDESINGNEDIAMLVRSRMPGIVGITADLHSLGERELNELHQQMELAKRLREALGKTTTYTLTPQTENPDDWHVVQTVSQATGTSVIFAYARDMEARIRVMLRQIASDRTYELRSADRGRVGMVRGADLVADGLDIHAAPESALQVLVLEPMAAAEP